MYRISVFFAAIAALVSCASTADFDVYEASVVKFKEATDITSRAVAEHIVTIRDVDRERLFSQLEAARDPCTVPWVRIRKPPTHTAADCAFLAIEVIREGRFSAEAIEARVQVFDALNDYTDLLSALATSDAPARWNVAAKGLGASVGGLVETIDKADNKEQLGDLRGLTGTDGPLTRLVSLAGEDWINKRRSEALDAAILRAKPQIDRISRLMRDDFRFVRRRDTFVANEELSDDVFAFAEAVDIAVTDETRDADRKKALTAVRTAIEANETKIEEVRSIGSVLDAFDDAHDALAAYAASSKTPDDLTRFIIYVDRYSKVAEDLLAALDDDTS